MVKTIKKDKLYQCKECGFHYQDKEWAEKCEQWCQEHKSCNLEITSHAEEINLSRAFCAGYYKRPPLFALQALNIYS